MKAPSVKKLQARIEVLEEQLREVVHHRYHGDRKKDVEGYWCFAGIQEECRAVLKRRRVPRSIREKRQAEKSAP